MFEESDTESVSGPVDSEECPISFYHDNLISFDDNAPATQNFWMQTDLIPRAMDFGKEQFVRINTKFLKNFLQSNARNIVLAEEIER